MSEKTKKTAVDWKINIPVMKLMNLFIKYRAGKVSFLALTVILISTFVGALSCTQEGTTECVAWEELRKTIKM